MKKFMLFDFMINMDIDMLNEISDKPTNINQYVIHGSFFL